MGLGAALLRHHHKLAVSGFVLGSSFGFGYTMLHGGQTPFSILGAWGSGRQPNRHDAQPALPLGTLNTAPRRIVDMRVPWGVLHARTGASAHLAVGLQQPPSTRA